MGNGNCMVQDIENIKFKDFQQKPSFLSKLPPVSQSPKTKTQKPNIKIKENQ